MHLQSIKRVIGRIFHIRIVPRKSTDWDYNARKHAEQAEIDRILDKIRKSGYDSLTKEEKAETL